MKRYRSKELLVPVLVPTIRTSVNVGLLRYSS